jgi:hypothetical protein
MRGLGFDDQRVAVGLADVFADVGLLLHPEVLI